MEKTKLGIPVGIMGAIVCFTGFTSNLLLMALIAGYILLQEKNEWLRRLAFKAFAVYLACLVGQSTLVLINEIIDIPALFANSNLSIPFNLDNVISTLINIIRYIVLGLMGLKAFKLGDVAIASLDDAFESKTKQEEKVSSVDLNK